jgi:hypothetical protein
VEGHPPDDEALPPLDETSSASDPGFAGSIAEGVKKALLAGVGALFLGEEGARRIARDWKLPKELASFVAQQAGGAKDELLRVFGEEFRRFLESETLRRELLKVLADNSIEIRAEIRLRPAGEGTPPRPEVSASVQAKPTSAAPRGGKKGGR